MGKYYKAKEFKESFNEIISELGISQNFKENPAFKIVIKDLLNKIPSYDGKMEEFDCFKLEDGKIYFEYNKLPENKKTTFQIFAPNADTIIYKSLVETNNLESPNKEFEEINITNDKFNFITEVTNSACLFKTDNPNKCINISHARKSKFTSDGIMMSKEAKFFNTEFDSKLEFAKEDAALFIPKSAFDGLRIIQDGYNRKEEIIRDKFDTAKITIEDKEIGMDINVVAELSRQHGLQTMETPTLQFMDSSEIMPMAKEEIDRIIEQEPNEKVKEGLRKYAQGRENYYYNSNEDPRFIYEKSSEGRSR